MGGGGSEAGTDPETVAAQEVAVRAADSQEVAERVADSQAEVGSAVAAAEVLGSPEGVAAPVVFAAVLAPAALCCTCQG